MCDDTAIRWSTYDTHVSEIESRTRHKIAEHIQQKIDAARTAGISNHFISGLELAKATALGFDPSEVSSFDQPTLL